MSSNINYKQFKWGTKEYFKAYYLFNREKKLDNAKSYYYSNKDRVKKENRSRWKRNRLTYLKKKSIYRKKNKDKILLYMRKYNKELYAKKKLLLGIPDGTPFEKRNYLKNIIDQILNLEGITEKKFSWLTSSKSWAMAYDIFYPSLNLAIEFNGRQHYHSHLFFHSGHTTLVIQKKNDRRKRYLSKKHNIKLISIPYNALLTTELLKNRLCKLRV